MSATNAVVNVDKDLGNGGEPELAMGGGIIKRGVGRGKEAVGEDLRNTLEGRVGDCSLRSVGKIGEEDGIGDGDGMRGFETFGESDSELAEGDGYQRYWSVGDEGFHGRLDLV